MIQFYDIIYLSIKRGCIMPSYITAFEGLCQNCRKRFRLNNVKITTVVNLDITGFEKTAFMDGSINRVRCNECDTEFTFETMMVIFSYIRRFAVFVNPRSDFNKSSGLHTPHYLLPDDFIFREVNYLIEAKEKVNAFLDGISDIDIEKIKLCKFSEDEAIAFDEYNIIYTSSEGSQYVFTKYDCNDIPVDRYNIICKPNTETNYNNANKFRHWQKINRLTITELCKGD